MTTVRKVLQRGLVAAAIMVLLILVFYSLAHAQVRIVNIPCDQDIDATINADPRSTASRFVLGADCPFVASATIVPSDGDEVACEVAPTFVQRGPAFDPTTRCTVAGDASVEKVFSPRGQGGRVATVRFEGIKITGGNFAGQAGTGVGIAAGSMSPSSVTYGVEVGDNDGAGISNCNGTFERIELSNTTQDPRALGFIGSGIKCVNESVIKNSYVHDNQGNGIWCDEECNDTSLGTFLVQDNLVVDNGGAGIRWEKVGGANAGEAIIENNEVRGNSIDAQRGGISVRDAQDAIIRNNSFGGNGREAAIIAADSGSSDRPNLSNIVIVNNTLKGEDIKGCELANTVVACAGNTPCGREHCRPRLRTSDNAPSRCFGWAHHLNRLFLPLLPRR